MAAQTTQYVTIRLAPGNFERGLRYARQQRGRYNPAGKTWDIPADCNHLNAPAMYGWIIVSDTRLERIAATLDRGELPEDC